jgi:glycosyltransferase involved in cell wall biosynthesis
MTLSVVMPAWNEAEGIAGFIHELNEALEQWQPSFIVVDDFSTDDTADAVRRLASQGIPATVVTNPSNRGHGPSTLTALQLGLKGFPSAIVALDGDGQFRGVDVATVVASLLAGTADVVEGVRRNRNDPLYRRLVSAGTRFLVWTRAGRVPADANTPLRAYRPSVLAGLLQSVPVSAVTPNLIISALCRRNGLVILEIPVASLPRRGASSVGTTWGNRRKALPSKRFLTFCARAVREWAQPTGQQGLRTGKSEDLPEGPSGDR